MKIIKIINTKNPKTKKEVTLIPVIAKAKITANNVQTVQNII
jgi:hypothetical protein